MAFSTPTARPRPPSLTARSASRGRAGFWVLVLLLLIPLALGTVAWRALSEPLPLREPELLSVPPGSNFRDFSALLRRRGWLNGELSETAFRLLARQTGADAKLKAGEYAILPGFSARDVLSLVVSGHTEMVEFRVREGSTVAEALAELAAVPDFRRTLPPNTDATNLLTRLGKGPAGASAEGLLFPDTYRLAKGSTDTDVLLAALALMSRVLNTEWQDRAPNLPYRNKTAALTMASIVEKETGRPDERAQVAGVFVRRLETGMKLQTDPTVIYGLGRAYKGDIRRVDLETDTPWNTYTRYGLPPTPICLPSRASVRAALHPDAGQSLYFVATGDGSGGHTFSATLAEHNAAVARFLARQRAGR